MVRAGDGVSHIQRLKDLFEKSQLEVCALISLDYPRETERGEKLLRLSPQRLLLFYAAGQLQESVQWRI